MKGKYAKTADARRAREGFEARAVTAERQVAAVREELASVQATAGTQIAALKQENTQLRAQRDEAASPALAVAEQRIRDLMSELDQARADAKQKQKLWNDAIKNATAMFKALGFTGSEALEAALMILRWYGKRTPIIVDNTAHVDGLSPEQIRTLEAARGFRGSDDVVQRLLDLLTATGMPVLSDDQQP